MKLTMTVPTSIGEEKYMHMQQYMVGYKHSCIAKQKSFLPDVQHQIMTAVSTPSYIKCNRKTLHNDLQW